MQEYVYLDIHAHGKIHISLCNHAISPVVPHIYKLRPLMVMSMRGHKITSTCNRSIEDSLFPNKWKDA